MVSAVGAVGFLIAIFCFNSFAAATANPVGEDKIGEHFRVVPAADGTNEVTLVGNGLNYQDTNGNWIQSIPIVQSFSNAIVCTGASYQVILGTNLNTYGSVDLELPADPATGGRGRMISHPLGLAFYDPDSGATVLLAPLKDCSAQVVSNQVIFADAFARSNGIQGSVTYSYEVGHFHQDITITARPSVTPADFQMGPNARLEMLTEFEQSPEPAVSESTVSVRASSTMSSTSAMTAQAAAPPPLTDQTLDYGTMRMGKGRAFSTAAPSPLNALTVTKQLVPIANQNFLTEDVPWDQAAEALQNLPAATNNAPPQASARRTMPRQQMIAQLSRKPATNVKMAKSFKERIAEVQRSQPLKLASLNSQLPGALKGSDGGHTPNSFVMDYELVQSCTNFTFQSGHTYLISSYVQIGYITIESGTVIKFSGGDLEPICGLTCPSSGPKAVLTDTNDNSVGATISGSVGYFSGVYYTFTALNLWGLDGGEEDGNTFYVNNLDIRFVAYGIVGPTIENNWCYIYDNWFFKCQYGISGSADFIVGPSSCDFCQVDTPFPSDLYAYQCTYCSVDRNGNGLGDDWEFQYFDSLTHSGSELDGNGNTLLYDYQHYANFPSVTISAPANNTSATTTRVNVTGTFVEPFLNQITVNGVKAFTSGTTFEALDVPLQPGANTITAIIEENSVGAIVRNIAQRTATASISVNGSASPIDPVQLTATPIAGFAPLSVNLQAASSAPGTLQQILYDFDGDGVIDQTANNLNSVSHTYSNPGEYFPVVTVVTSAGRFSSSGGWNSVDFDRLMIDVQAPPVVQSTISVTDPVDLKTTAAGNLYVLSGSTATIFEYDSSGTLLRSLAGIGTSPFGLDVDSTGNVYVALTGDNQVLKFNPTASSFQLDTTFGTGGHIGKNDKTSGSGNGEFHSPFDVAIDPGGTEIVVSDSGNNRIVRFTVAGTYISSFGELGNLQGQFNTPKGVTYDDSGYLYIVDSGNNRIDLVRSSVVIISGASGTSLGQFQGPVNLGVGSRGIYVADTGNNRVQEFDPVFTGEGASPVPFTVRGSLASEALLNQPSAVATVEDPLDEKVYIADTGHDRVVLVKLPNQDPLQTWNGMKTAAASGNVAATVSNFSTLSRDSYRKAFLSNGSAISLINPIGSLTAVYVKGDEAKYYFTDTVGGQTITFPVDFVKENGIWKILEF